MELLNALRHLKKERKKSWSGVLISLKILPSNGMKEEHTFKDKACAQILFVKKIKQNKTKQT